MKLSIISLLGVAALAAATPIVGQSENASNVLVKRCSNYNATSACQQACKSVANRACASCNGNPSCHSACYTARKNSCDRCCSNQCRTC